MIDNELQLRLMKQRVPLIYEQRKLQVLLREKRKELYNISKKLRELDDEILSLEVKTDD